MKMNITYDPDADAAYITVRDTDVAQSTEIDVNTVADFDAAGELVGIELLFVNERNPDLLKQLRSVVGKA